MKRFFSRNDKTSLATDIADVNMQTGDVFWPQDLLPHDCGRARVLTWGYESHVTKGYESANKNNVFAHAKNLLATLKRERTEGRPIIFVAHSLGGILVKEVLRRSNESTQDIVGDIVRSTSAVIFLGTPHRGSAKLADIGEAFRRAASIILRVDSNSTIVRALGADSPELEVGRESFIVLWRKYKFSVKTFQESKPLTGVNISILNGLVVPKESSSLDDPEENAETIEADHHMMCKFYGAEDPGYRQVSGELRGFIYSISQRQHESQRTGSELEFAEKFTNRLMGTSFPVNGDLTGLESVGFLLKHIPLLINAVQYYIDGASTDRTTKQYENIFIDSQMRLISSMDMFEKCCRRLVQNLPDTEVRNLMELQRGWNEPKIEAGLRQRLGEEDFEDYIIIVKRVKKRVRLLQRKLKLQADFEEPFKMWSFMPFDSGKYTEVVTEIHKEVEQIWDLTQKDIEPRAAQYERSPPPPSDHWLDIRAHTSRIFNVISSIWPRNCMLHTHHAKLRLDIPTEGKKNHEIPKVIVSFATDKGVDSVQRRPQEWLDASVISCQTSSPTVSKKAVQSSPPSKNIGPVQMLMACTSERKIEDLCTVLEESRQISCLGFVPSEGWHYHIHDPANVTRKLTRLGDVLTSQKITTRQKRTIALALAFGVLQLYDTPWIRESWTIDDIYVDSSQGIEHLYVLKAFETSSPQSAIGNARTDLDLFVRNRTLFALGVALLELTYGAPLSARKADEDLNDVVTQVLHLTSRIKDDELPRFARAVFRCIHPAPEGFEFSLADEGFRRRFVQEVVVPLKKDYDELPR
ncbi:hypothetical protein CNMCM5793_006733 [Aspergillus hiratsukae]|uniref:DUF7580 domain-containing protein n=1 Tax=Aspergillus hiratsukae TaxID=1194566 RepID=A0A8H6PHC7_9EURO|nr:hypothetical protein CNMCM5793_006733 [Aspergillus hiratsukae]KAF7172634.1 hypothetical protein CNMCM6106_006778 [Aspergillus hiratsukae]